MAAMPVKCIPTMPSVAIAPHNRIVTTCRARRNSAKATPNAPIAIVADRAVNSWSNCNATGVR